MDPLHDSVADKVLARRVEEDGETVALKDRCPDLIGLLLSF